MLLRIDGKPYDGELSLTFSDNENGETIAYLNIYLNIFLTELSEIRCEIGIFKGLSLTQIAIGTKDSVAIYQLTTKEFCLDAQKINEMLLLNGGEESE